jgi:hypothetical protein
METDTVKALVENALLYAVAPVWMLAGFADFTCHRIMRIEENAGIRESLLHLLMIAQLAVAALCPLLLEPTTAVLAIMLCACVAHEATTAIDLAYAETHRRVPWFEQWVHGLQQALPWIWLAGWTVAQSPQVLAMMDGATADWTLRPRSPGLPVPYLLTFVGSALLLVAAPFAYECWCCLRQRRLTRSGSRSGSVVNPG